MLDRYGRRIYSMLMRTVTSGLLPLRTIRTVSGQSGSITLSKLCTTAGQIALIMIVNTCSDDGAGRGYGSHDGHEIHWSINAINTLNVTAISADGNIATSN
jgi:hypothetical protein